MHDVEKPQGKLEAALVAALLGLVCFLLVLTGSWNDSPSADEPEHLSAGFCYVNTGEFWLNPGHPPLVKDLAGLALSAAGIPEAPQAWRGRNKNLSINAPFLAENPQKVIRLARWPMVLMASAFVAVYFWMLWVSAGPRVAIVATLLLLLFPTYLAHGALVHTDVPAAAAAFCCLWLLAYYLKRPQPYLLVGLGVAMGLAQLVKFSLVLLWPVFLVALWNRWRDTLVVLGLAIGVIWICYGLHQPVADHQEAYNAYLLGNDPVAFAIEASGRMPLLRSLSWYATGVYAQTIYVARGSKRPQHVLGRYRRGGDWRFFPVLLLTKIPVGSLSLLLLSLPGLFLLVRDDRQRQEALLYGGFACLFTGVAMAGNLNLGLRHLLPVLPCVFALAGLGVARLGQEVAMRWQPFILGWVVLALGASAYACATTWPHFLAYYNPVGGPSVALDSDYDWGVDLHRLGQAAENEGWPAVYCLYLGWFSPEHYLGPRWRQFPSHPPADDSRLVVSLYFYRPLREALDETKLDSGLVEWLRGAEFERQVGTSMVVLKVPGLKEARPGDALPWSDTRWAEVLPPRRPPLPKEIR